jgi:hypothetical protein
MTEIGSMKACGSIATTSKTLLNSTSKVL